MILDITQWHIPHELHGFKFPTPRYYLSEDQVAAMIRDFNEATTDAWCIGWECQSTCRECIMAIDDHWNDNEAKLDAFADWLFENGVEVTRKGYERSSSENLMAKDTLTLEE